MKFEIIKRKMKNNMDMRTLAKMVFHWQYDDN